MDNDLKERQVLAAAQIIEQNGRCKGIKCEDCPLRFHPRHTCGHDEDDIKYCKQWLKDNAEECER